jgi:hypothetical protein
MKNQLIPIGLGFASCSFLFYATVGVSYEILPAKLLKRPYLSVGSKVTNEGQMNHYMIKSKFGSVKADSTAELKIRVDQMRALVAMKRVSNSGKFTTQVKAGGKILWLARRPW